MPKCLVTFYLMITFHHVYGQDNYEIQVYGSKTVQSHATMLELHSNFTFGGSRATVNNLLPTNHILHETIEITQGLNDWFEIGGYIFTALGNNGRTSYVGSHIRPRAMVPADRKWPFGVSLSVEGGFQKLQYSEDDWSLEIRPIIDKNIDKFYLSFNPTFDKALHGMNAARGFIFSPNLKASYFLSNLLSLGIEYYGSVGNLTHFSPYNDQQHQVFIAADVNFSPDWEMNFGYGFGFTHSTDGSIIKLILGYRLNSQKPE